MLQNSNDIYMLNYMPKNIEELYSILETYRICIDFENVINSLVAASLNCYCITSYFCPGLDYYTQIKNIDDINNTINLISSKIDYKELNNQKQKILELFSFDNFNRKISNIISLVTKEKFLL